MAPTRSSPGNLLTRETADIVADVENVYLTGLSIRLLARLTRQAVAIIDHGFARYQQLAQVDLDDVRVQRAPVMERDAWPQRDGPSRVVGVGRYGLGQVGLDRSRRRPGGRAGRTRCVRRGTRSNPILPGVYRSC